MWLSYADSFRWQGNICHITYALFGITLSVVGRGNAICGSDFREFRCRRKAWCVSIRLKHIT
jgi:hypothetical protein